MPSPCTVRLPWFSMAWLPLPVMVWPFKSMVTVTPASTVRLAVTLFCNVTVPPLAMAAFSDASVSSPDCTAFWFSSLLPCVSRVAFSSEVPSLVSPTVSPVDLPAPWSAVLSSANAVVQTETAITVASARETTFLMRVCFLIFVFLSFSLRFEHTAQIIHLLYPPPR